MPKASESNSSLLKQACQYRLLDSVFGRSFASCDHDPYRTVDLWHLATMEALEYCIEVH